MQQQQQPAWVSVLMGGASKIVASTATYPSQVIKSRLQQRDGSPTTKRYAGLVDCVLKISRQEGLAGFFRGVLPNALKVAPSAALTFVVYEELIKLNL
jgi:solute carrier family 25 folate transporter 32